VESTGRMVAVMICPLTGGICNAYECRTDGCLEQREEDGEDLPDECQKKN
jgi:hypothetical protein